MRLRRLTGFLLTLFTLHLNLLGADFACATHGPTQGDDASEHTMMTTTSSSHMHAGAHAEMTSSATHAAAASTERSAHEVDATEVAGTQPPCDVPVQPTCCNALASCSVVFSNGNILEVVGLLNLSPLVAHDATTAPPSERAAPEPPPPKA